MPKDSTGDVIDPNASDTELELEWIDRMQRAANPLPDRLAFFWHRHWAISRDDGLANDLILQYRNRLLRYADLARNPTATFRDLAIEMTTKDAAMSQYLNINQNIKGKPNENYARELMELFCLGPKAPDGTDNYSQTDVAELARALTGWTFNNTSTVAAYGTTTFTPSRFEMGVKTLFTANPYSAQRIIPAVTGSTNTTTNPASLQWGPTAVNLAVNAVLEHANHAQFLIRKLWAEFIASPIPQDTLDSLSAAYRTSGYQLEPLIRGILAHPLLMESLDEPNLIKPPMVYIIGALRAIDAPLKHNQIEAAMNAMQQKVYFPPNVSGWEGGMSWLNTNTVQGRFDLIAKLQYLKYSNYYDGVTPLRGRRQAGRRPGVVRPRLRVGEPAVAVRRHARGDPQVRGPEPRQEPGEQHARGPAPASLRPPSADARRPRRTGDVTCAASNAKRSSSRGSVTSGRGRRCRSRTPRWTASRRAAARPT